MDELTRVRAHFRAMLAAKRSKPVAPLSPPPRYDEVYARGTAWLDWLAEADLEAAGTQATHSGDRHDAPPAIQDSSPRE